MDFELRMIITQEVPSKSDGKRKIRIFRAKIPISFSLDSKGWEVIFLTFKTTLKMMLQGAKRQI